MSPDVEPPDRGFEDEEFAREPATELGAGDLAIVPFPAARERIGCAAEAGLVLEDRKSVVKVFFPTTDRTFWIGRDQLRSVTADQLPLHPLVARLHAIARRVDAEQIDIYEERDDVGVFHVFCRGMSLEDLLAVRTMLGEDLRHLRIDPGSVRRTRLTIAFRLP